MRWSRARGTMTSLIMVHSAKPGEGASRGAAGSGRNHGGEPPQQNRRPYLDARVRLAPIARQKNQAARIRRNGLSEPFDIVDVERAA